MKIKKILIPILGLFLVSCSNSFSSENTIEAYEEKEEITYFEDFLKDEVLCVDSFLNKLNQPINNVLQNNEYTFHNNKYYFTVEIENMYILEGRFPFSIERELTKQEELYFIEHSEIENITIKKPNTTISQNLKVGTSKEELESKNIYFHDDDYCFTSKVKNTKDTWITIMFENNSISSFTLSSNDVTSTINKEEIKTDFDEIDKSFKYLKENKIGDFDANDLEIECLFYSSFFGSYFYRFCFVRGENEGKNVNIEVAEPKRIFLSNNRWSEKPVLYWINGQFINPVNTFLGIWTDSYDQDYINIKSISDTGTLIFDWSTNGNFLENVNAFVHFEYKTLNDILNGLSTFGGTCEFSNGVVTTGILKYCGSFNRLCDFFNFDFFTNKVEYYCTTAYRDGFDSFIHIPGNENYPNNIEKGYLSGFGSKNKNFENNLLYNNKGGENIINNYLNKKNNTESLLYAEQYFDYLYDYCSPIGVIFHVWKKKNSSDLYYVDENTKSIIIETEIGPLFPTNKELVFKNDEIVNTQSLLLRKWVDKNNDLVINYNKETKSFDIVKENSFIKNITDVEATFLDKYDNRYIKTYHLFSFNNTIGNLYFIRGYFALSKSTWDLEMHVTCSNIPGFESNVYYLKSESDIFQSEIINIDVPEGEKDPGKYIDDKTTTATTIIVRSFDGKIVGKIEVDEKGNKTVRNFSGKILGYYKVDLNITTDFYGKILAKGDIASALLFMNV